MTASARTTLMVTDLGRASRFYTHVLGFHVTASAPGSIALAAPHLSRELVLHAVEHASPSPAYQAQTALRLRLPSRAALAGVCDALARGGARVMIVERSQRLSAHTTDPEGHKLELYASGEAAVGSLVRPRILSLDDLKAHA